MLLDEAHKELLLKKKACTSAAGTPQQRQLAAAIIEAECAVQLLTPPVPLGALRLLVAIERGWPCAIAQLLREGATPNGLSDGAEPPLVAAARLADVAAVRLLVAAGASVDGEEGGVTLRNDALGRRLAASRSDYDPPLVAACASVKAAALGPMPSTMPVASDPSLPPVPTQSLPTALAVAVLLLDAKARQPLLKRANARQLLPLTPHTHAAYGPCAARWEGGCERARAAGEGVLGGGEGIGGKPRIFSPRSNGRPRSTSWAPTRCARRCSWQPGGGRGLSWLPS